MITKHNKDNVVSYHKQITTIRRGSSVVRFTREDLVYKTSKSGFNPRITKQNHVPSPRGYLYSPDGHILYDPDGNPLFAGDGT